MESAFQNMHYSIWSSNFHSSSNSKLLEWEQFSIFDITMQLIECWWNDVRNGWDEFSKFQSKDRLHGWVDLCFIWMDHIWDLVVGELSSTRETNSKARKKEFEIQKSGWLGSKNVWAFFIMRLDSFIFKLLV